MKKHIDTVIGDYGRPVAGASVTVYLTGTTTPATIYSDNGVTTQPNPTTTDSSGMFYFYVANGRYDIKITSGSSVKTLTDVLIEDSTPIFDYLASSAGSSYIGHIASGANSVARTAQSKMRDIVNSSDYTSLSTALSSSSTKPVIDASTGDAYLRGDLKVGDKDMFGYPDNTIVQVYGDLGLPTTIQSMSRFVMKSKGDNATFIGGNAVYIEARDRDDVTSSNKGVLYPLTISVVPKEARNNVPYDDANGINITNTTGVVGAKATDGIYFSANQTAFGDKTTGTSAWYSGITIDANTDYGIQFGARILNYAIDMNLSNIVSGSAIRLPNSAKIVARDAANATDRTLINLDSSDVVNIGSGAARVDLKVAAIAASGLQVTGDLKNNGFYIPMIIGQSGAESSLTGTTSETTLATIAVPANSMLANGILRIVTYWSCTNSANSKTARVRFDGNIFAGLSVTTVSSLQIVTMIRNKNATNSQESYGESSNGGFGTTTTSPRTAAVDTTLAKNITITGQLANSGENLKLIGYSVELMPNA